MATITGTPGPDELSSTHAGDEIQGLDGSDVLTAYADNMSLDGGDGIDQLFTFNDGATLIGGPGYDELYGWGTNDTASYAGSYASDPSVVINTTTGVIVNLADGEATADGYGSTDYLEGIENITGSWLADSLTGDDGANIIKGLAGDDQITGGLGADTL